MNGLDQVLLGVLGLDLQERCRTITSKRARDLIMRYEVVARDCVAITDYEVGIKGIKSFMVFEGPKLYRWHIFEREVLGKRVIVFIGAWAHAIATILLLATTGTLFYVGGLVSSLGPIVAHDSCYDLKLVPLSVRGKCIHVILGDNSMEVPEVGENETAIVQEAERCENNLQNEGSCNNSKH
ncbi:hypothetical protein EVAR_91319_1 [Eumeta japonica]|uniref:Uncharacterized protein n=1 Tax=Eumeta variegata TaxID=151549 RepID=A0A4C1TIH7_EUMVA|nr:hypothetical protein EVAR_91319_1 [Eumeta japonica]